MKPISEHVREAFPCDCHNSLTEYGGHMDWCNASDPEHHDRATRLAEAVRAECVALLREAREMLDNGRECDDCGPSVTDLKRRIDAALAAQGGGT